MLCVALLSVVHLDTNNQISTPHHNLNHELHHLHQKHLQQQLFQPEGARRRKGFKVQNLVVTFRHARCYTQGSSHPTGPSLRFARAEQKTLFDRCEKKGVLFYKKSTRRRSSDETPDFLWKDMRTFGKI